MWNNKLKAVTFSFDDGVIQDKRLIKLLDKYNLKATFNLNSGKDHLICFIPGPKEDVKHETLFLKEIKEVYKNHEVASHTLLHPFLPNLKDDEIIKEVKEDSENLEKIVGYKINGFAYPGGGYDKRVVDLIKNNTDIKYCRTVTSTHSFDLQDNLLVFNPTVYWIEEELEEIVDRFINLKADKPQLLYIWGHSYEGDGFELWEKFENICKKLANRDDIFYGTNSECLLDK